MSNEPQMMNLKDRNTQKKADSQNWTTLKRIATVITHENEDEYHIFELQVKNLIHERPSHLLRNFFSKKIRKQL